MFIDPAIDVGDAAVRAVRGWGFNSRNTHSDVWRFLIHNCTIFLCSLDVGNIDDQFRGPSIKEEDHLVG